VSEEVKKQLDFVFLEHIDDAIAAGLESQPAAAAEGSARAA
jgi:hypothetical protein